MIWTSNNISFDEYTALGISNILLYTFLGLIGLATVTMFFAQFIKIKGKRISAWTADKIAAYAVVFSAQLLIIYILNTVLAIIAIIVLSAGVFVFMNYYAFPRTYSEAQKGRFSILNDYRDEEEKEFSRLDYSSKADALESVPTLQQMRLKPLSYFIVAAVIPGTIAAAYYFALR